MRNLSLDDLADLADYIKRELAILDELSPSANLSRTKARWVNLLKDILTEVEVSRRLDALEQKVRTRREGRTTVKEL